jgi:hypothetical protein
MSEPIDCNGLDQFDPVHDLGYWDVEPKNVRVNCSENDVSFPLMVYGVRRDEVTYQVVNPQIAGVSPTGELTLGTVRGVTMVVITRKDDPCEVRYVQVAVECPCDEPVGCQRTYQTGGETLDQDVESPSLMSVSPAGSSDLQDAADPRDDCDGGATLSLVVSGFQGNLSELNGVHVLARAAPRVWVDGSRSMQVRGTTSGWRVEVGIGTDRFAWDTSANFECAGGHPVGSGTLTASSQTGQYTID